MRLRKHIHLFIRRTVFWLVSGINFVIPKKKNRIFIADTSTVRDNQYILAKYLVSAGYNDKYEIAFYTDDENWIDKELLKKLTLVKGKANGLWYRWTAKYVFWAFGSNFMSCASPPWQTTVDMWHGFGLKKIQYESMKNKKATIPIEYTFNKVIISSELYRKMVKRSLHCSDSKVTICGAPKVDALFQNGYGLQKLGVLERGFDKVIFYLPTYRNSSRLGCSGYSQDLPMINEDTIKDINDSLRKLNCCLVVKLHHTAQRDNNIAITKQTYSNVVFLTNDDFNRYDAHFYNSLGQADALITDYSSVYQDYLVLDRPIAFVIDDFEEYEEIRGFNFKNPLQLMPGHLIRNVKDFSDFISDVATGRDTYEVKRGELSKVINENTSRDNCKLLLDKCDIHK